MNAKTFHFITVLLTASLIVGCVQQGVGLPQETQAVATEQIVVTEIAATPEPTEPVSTDAVIVTEEPQATETFESLAYIGIDGNLWLVNAATQQQTQVTQDAGKKSDDDQNAVGYMFPQWSPDGGLIAYQRVVGQGSTGSRSLEVYNVATKETKSYLQDTLISGISWKPSTHQIAYGLGFNPANGIPAADQAKGIMQIDIDSGEVVELVKPERDYQLILPVWSENAAVLSFMELFEVGKTGNFASYDFTSQTYTSWEVPAGSYSLYPDGSFVVYDNWYEEPQGSTAIHIKPTKGGEDTQLSPDIQDGFSYSPVISPDGARIAYLADLDGSGDVVTLYIMDIAGSPARELGKFQNGSDLQWTMDSSHLIVTRGPYEATEIVLLNTTDGALTVLANGRQPDWNPAGFIRQ